MSPKTFSILCICQALVISVFTAIVIYKVTADWFSPIMITMMAGMIIARLWKTRNQPL